MRVFGNGVLLETKTGATLSEVGQATTTTSTIGYYPEYTLQQFEGEIADVLFYNRQLSLLEVALLASNPGITTASGNFKSFDSFTSMSLLILFICQ